MGTTPDSQIFRVRLKPDPLEEPPSLKKPAHKDVILSFAEHLGVRRF